MCKDGSGVSHCLLFGCGGAARLLGSGLYSPGFQLLSLAAIAFLSDLSPTVCSGSLDTGSLDLETDFDGKNFLDIFLGWEKSVKMRKDICASCSLSNPSRQVRGGGSGIQAAAQYSAASTVGLVVFMLVSAGTIVAAAAAVDACIVQVMGAILFGLADDPLLEVLCCACLGAAPGVAPLFAGVFTLVGSFVFIDLVYIHFAGRQLALEGSQQLRVVTMP